MRAAEGDLPAGTQGPARAPPARQGGGTRGNRTQPAWRRRHPCAPWNPTSPQPRGFKDGVWTAQPVPLGCEDTGICPHSRGKHRSCR